MSGRAYTIAYTALHYGADYLGWAIRSVIDAIDEYVVLYAAQGSHVFRTTLPCPDNRKELYTIARQAARDKLRWYDGEWLAMNSICRAEHFVLCGLADSWWPAAETGFEQLLASFKPKYIVSVAVFESLPHHRAQLGMCALRRVDDDVEIEAIVDHPTTTELTAAWGALIWRREFWQYIDAAEPHVGYAVQRALNSGQRVAAQCFDAPYYNCNTLAVYREGLNASFEERQ